MYGWIKHFADGTEVIGTDHDVQKKKTSWSKGRLTGMIGVEVIHGNKRMAIFTPGEFWQSDDYDVNLLDSTPILVTRRLQYKIQGMDGLCEKQQPDNVVFCKGDSNFDIGRVGKWLTLELDIKTGKISCNVKENRI